MLRAWLETIYSNQGPPLRFAASLVSHLALASIGSLAFSAFASLPTLAAPGITLKGSFDFTTGPYPYAALTPNDIISADGSIVEFFGTTVVNADGRGAIFQFSPFNTEAEAINLKTSINDENGDSLPYSYSTLTRSNDFEGVIEGRYYGTASGGPSGVSSRFPFGTIFEFKARPPANKPNGLELKGSFNFADGAYPYSALTPAGNGTGKFYGTTSGGGDNNKGTIFEFDPSGAGITRKGSFTGANGANPYAALTPADNGKFYGTTRDGGAHNKGSIFEFDPSHSGITLKGSFTGANGANPYADLTPADNGTFYGTTSGGGANSKGTIFQFDPSDGSIILKGNFTGANGANPLAALTPAGNGKFYGTTKDGGDNDIGTIFEFDPSGGGIILKSSFDGANGANPYAALTPAGNGKFYGTTSGGGVYSKGTIFEFNPVNDPAPTVPGPLPLLGAGAAFGWSRKLRRRLLLQQPGARSLA
jgi:uncharacterized repeat protein (TIGR03803 family)